MSVVSNALGGTDPTRTQLNKAERERQQKALAEQQARIAEQQRLEQQKAAEQKAAEVVKKKRRGGGKGRLPSWVPRTAEEKSKSPEGSAKKYINTPEGKKAVEAQEKAVVDQAKKQAKEAGAEFNKANIKTYVDKKGNIVTEYKSGTVTVGKTISDTDVYKVSSKGKVSLKQAGANTQAAIQAERNKPVEPIAPKPIGYTGLGTPVTKYQDMGTRTTIDDRVTVNIDGVEREYSTRQLVPAGADVKITDSVSGYVRTFDRDGNLINQEITTDPAVRQIEALEEKQGREVISANYRNEYGKVVSVSEDLFTAPQEQRPGMRFEQDFLEGKLPEGVARTARENTIYLDTLAGTPSGKQVLFDPSKSEVKKVRRSALTNDQLLQVKELEKSGDWKYSGEIAVDKDTGQIQYSGYNPKEAKEYYKQFKENLKEAARLRKEGYTETKNPDGSSTWTKTETRQATEADIASERPIEGRPGVYELLDKDGNKIGEKTVTTTTVQEGEPAPTEQELTNYRPGVTEQIWRGTVGFGGEVVSGLLNLAGEGEVRVYEFVTGQSGDRFRESGRKSIQGIKDATSTETLANFYGTLADVTGSPAYRFAEVDVRRNVELSRASPILEPISLASEGVAGGVGLVVGDNEETIEARRRFVDAPRAIETRPIEFGITTGIDALTFGATGLIRSGGSSTGRFGSTLGRIGGKVKETVSDVGERISTRLGTLPKFDFAPTLVGIDKPGSVIRLGRGQPIQGRFQNPVQKQIFDIYMNPESGGITGGSGKLFQEAGAVKPESITGQAVPESPRPVMRFDPSAEGGQGRYIFDKSPVAELYPDEIRFPSRSDIPAGDPTPEGTAFRRGESPESFERRTVSDEPAPRTERAPEQPSGLGEEPSPTSRGQQTVQQRPLTKEAEQRLAEDLAEQERIRTKLQKDLEEAATKLEQGTVAEPAPVETAPQATPQMRYYTEAQTYRPRTYTGYEKPKNATVVPVGGFSGYANQPVKRRGKSKEVTYEDAIYGSVPVAFAESAPVLGINENLRGRLEVKDSPDVNSRLADTTKRMTSQFSMEKNFEMSALRPGESLSNVPVVDTIVRPVTRPVVETRETTIVLPGQDTTQITGVETVSIQDTLLETILDTEQVQRIKERTDLIINENFVIRLPPLPPSAKGEGRRVKADRKQKLRVGEKRYRVLPVEDLFRISDPQAGRKAGKKKKKGSGERDDMELMF